MQPVQLTAPSWPLQRWGKLTPAQENYSFIVVAVEYFTTWAEAKLVTNVSSATMKKFFWQNIICRYDLPCHIIVDNAKYFDNAMFKDSYQQVGTKVAFTFVYHAQKGQHPDI
jgi:hypothetical protein